MMLISVPYDVGGALVAIGGVLLLLTLVISIVESIVMLLLKWNKFSRSFWASLLMNVTSTIIGMFWVFAMGFLSDLNIWLIFAVSFLLSVLIEGGILMLMKRGATWQNWIVSLIANLVSYLFIILPSFIRPQILGAIARFLGL